MKQLLILSLSVLCTLTGMAQNTESSKVGTIEYYEGKVLIGDGVTWTEVKLHSAVNKQQSIRTVDDAMAEITWNNGTVTVVGPDSELSITSLIDGSTSDAQRTTKGSFDNFKRIFADTQSNQRTQEGGIRRDDAKKRDKPSKEEIYWKQEEEVDFDEAWAEYDEGNYATAIRKFELFIRQKPGSDHIKHVYFGLAHSYIMSNNPVKAKEILDRFKLEFPEDELAVEADKIIANLE